MSRPAGMRAIAAAWTTALMVAVGLLVVVVTYLVVTWPRPWDVWVREVVLRDAKPAAWPALPSAESVAGCYALRFDDWIPREDLGPDTCFVSVPLTVELTLTPWKGSPNRFVVRPTGGSSASVHHINVWSITAERTLSVAWSTGFSGVEAELGPRGDVLQGTARTFWDFPRTTQWARVTARRTACPAGPKE